MNLSPQKLVCANDINALLTNNDCRYWRGLIVQFFIHSHLEQVPHQSWLSKFQPLWTCIESPVMTGIIGEMLQPILMFQGNVYTLLTFSVNHIIFWIEICYESSRNLTTFLFFYYLLWSRTKSNFVSYRNFKQFKRSWFPIKYNPSRIIFN